MRILPAILLSAAFLCTRAKAQSHLVIPTGPYPGAYAYPGIPPPATADSSSLNSKWQLRPFGGLSLGYVFFHGGGSPYVSAPVGLALYRPLSRNFTAFTAVSVAPTVFSMNSLYTYPGLRQTGNTFSGPYGLNVGSRVELGLMYTNDAKTFSISGSVGVERDSYPVYVPARTDNRKQ